MTDGFFEAWGRGAVTTLGFFWKAAWAFVLGYAISAAIQAFVPRAHLSRAMGGGGVKALSLSTGFGALSSSCSFAALAAARALFAKGAHFVASVAFMFASTNLVIELGILILIFLGPAYLAAELVGGVVLVLVSAALIRATYPRRWVDAARDKVRGEVDQEPEDFDPWARVRSIAGWRRVSDGFVMEWGMVWRDVLIGFVIAGFVKALVPAAVFRALFLADGGAPTPASSSCWRTRWWRRSPPPRRSSARWATSPWPPS